MTPNPSGRLVGHFSTMNIETDENRLRDRQGSKLLLRRVSRAVVQLRCTDMAMITFGLVAGFLGILLQIFSIGTEQWLVAVEPRTVNKTNEKGEHLEVRFEYQAGFWRVCRTRMREKNESFTLPADMLEYYSTSEEFYLRCIKNEFFSPNTQMESFAGATAAIMTEIQIAAFGYIISLALQTVATVLSMIGHFKNDNRTLYGGILYITAGLCTATSILKYICVVDEEMSPRMKPTSEGEPSKYDYGYGYSFLGGALSFLVIQLCAICQLTLFFRRFPSLEDKMSLIPGLREKVRRAQVNRELGVPCPEMKIGQLSAHTSPRRSFSASPSLGDQKTTFARETTTDTRLSDLFAAPLITTYGFDGQGFCSEKSYMV